MNASSNPSLHRTPASLLSSLQRGVRPAPVSSKPLGAAVKLWAGRARSSVWPARADWHRSIVAAVATWLRRAPGPFGFWLREAVEAQQTPAYREAQARAC